MKFEQWEVTYEEIISHFGYSRDQDKISAELLSEYRGTDGLKPLKELNEQVVEISGPYYSEKKSEKSDMTISAGSTIERLEKIGIKPDLMVTDLDGNIELQLELNLEGIPAAIHAHGDNRELIKKWPARFEGPVISTCQCKPPNDQIYNFGGFTDGDRAAYIADHFGASEIILNGWDFDHPYDGKREKLEKLNWAEKLLAEIETPVEKL